MPPRKTTALRRQTPDSLWVEWPQSPFAINGFPPYSQRTHFDIREDMQMRVCDILRQKANKNLPDGVAPQPDECLSQPPP